MAPSRLRRPPSLWRSALPSWAKRHKPELWCCRDRQMSGLCVRGVSVQVLHGAPCLTSPSNGAFKLWITAGSALASGRTDSQRSAVEMCHGHGGISRRLAATAAMRTRGLEDLQVRAVCAQDVTNMVFCAFALPHVISFSTEGTMHAVGRQRSSWAQEQQTMNDSVVAPAMQVGFAAAANC